MGSLALSGESLGALAGPLREQAVPLLYLSLVTTVFANWLQTVGQREVSAPDAAIIYALDPVYGAGFSYLLLGETLGPQGAAELARRLGHDCAVGLPFGPDSRTNFDPSPLRVAPF